MKVKRTEQIWLKPNKQIGELAHLSKNLYNEANYIIRQELFNTKKWVRYNKLNELLKKSENYKGLPAQTSQQTLKLIDKDWKSFFRAIKEYRKHPENFLGRPRIPKYKEKNGEHILIFTNQQAKLKGDYLFLPKKTELKIKTRIKKGLREVRIIPRGMGYVLEIVYEKIIRVMKRNKKRIVGIDIGVRNLITMVNNIGIEPIVVKGGVAKSINQYFNKEKAVLQSIYDKQGTKTGKKIRKLQVKRERKLNNYFHKVSRFVVNWCVEHRIGTIVIGHNNNWKQEVMLGRRNNQSFVQIPFMKPIHQIEYKAEEKGIKVMRQDESHTSKCSFLDNEPIKHHKKYVGKRKSRGLFRTRNGVIINADVNAGYNIIRKAFPNVFGELDADGIEGVGLHPNRLVI